MFTRIVLFIFLLIATSCSRNEFRMEFSLPADLNANYSVVYYATAKNGGFWVETVANIANGKGMLNCATAYPLVAYLYSGNALPIVIYAEKGDKISISGSGAAPAEWQIEGNDTNRLLSEWRNGNAEAIISGNPEKINKAVADFVVKNPDSPIAPLLLITSFSRIYDESLFRFLWHTASDEHAKRKWTKLVSRMDIHSSSVKAPGILKSMAFRSLYNGVDTLRPDSAGAILLFFWHNGMERRNEYIDSIKSLSRTFPDSASRVIADVCIDADSISWNAPLRHDSTKNIARLWVPAGFADTRLMDLAVTRTPFFIVFDPEGNQVYRGSDVEKAMSKFKDIMN